MSHRDSIKKTLLVAFTLCVVASALVTTTTVLLRPIQEKNRLLDRQKNILAVAGLLQTGKSIQELSSRLETRIVDIQSGRFVDIENPGQFDQHDASRHPLPSTAMTPKQDIAKIQRRANHALVYLLRDTTGQIKTIVLPVHGYGLWSTLYGFLALASDTRTVEGLSFYEHADTPGLGGEVDNPRWKALWPGKQVYDEYWQPTIQLVKGGVDPDDPTTKHQIDALSGATLTNHGIENLLRFWLGNDGFAPFLTRLRREGLAG